MLLLFRTLSLPHVLLLFILAALESKRGLIPSEGASGGASPVGLLAMQQGAAHLFQNRASLLLKSARTAITLCLSLYTCSQLLPTTASTARCPVPKLRPMTVMWTQDREAVGREKLQALPSVACAYTQPPGRDKHCTAWHQETSKLRPER